jgi:hypothetical protein
MISVEFTHVGDRDNTNHGCGDDNCGNATTDLQGSERNTEKCMNALTALSRKMGKLSFTIYKYKSVEVGNYSVCDAYDVTE